MTLSPNIHAQRLYSFMPFGPVSLYLVSLHPVSLSLIHFATSRHSLEYASKRDKGMLTSSIQTVPSLS